MAQVVGKRARLKAEAKPVRRDGYVFILPGNTVGFALNTGRMAGTNAVEYMKGLGR